MDHDAGRELGSKNDMIGVLSSSSFAAAQQVSATRVCYTPLKIHAGARMSAMRDGHSARNEQSTVFLGIPYPHTPFMWGALGSGTASVQPTDHKEAV